MCSAASELSTDILSSSSLLLRGGVYVCSATSEGRDCVFSC